MATPEQLTAQLQDPVKARSAMMQIENYVEHDGLLYRIDYGQSLSRPALRWVVPQGGRTIAECNGRKTEVSLRQEMCLWFHNMDWVGHPDRDTTYARMEKAVYFPKMWDMVSRWVKTCQVCRRKGREVLPNVQYRPEHTSSLFAVIMIDLIGEIKPTTVRGNKWALTAVC